jgi:hypothetical protein
MEEERKTTSEQSPKEGRPAGSIPLWEDHPAYKSDPVAQNSSIGLKVVGFLLIVLVIGGAALWLFRDEPKYFVPLPPGSYAGVIEGALNHSAVPLYIERAPENRDLFVAVLKAGWNPQFRDSPMVADPESSDPDARGFIPLLLSDGVTQVELSGGESNGSEYFGRAYNITNAKEGVWRLRPIYAPPSDLAAQEGAVKLWLSLRAEVQGVRDALSALDQQVRHQRAEIERLSQLVAEGQELRMRANSRFADVRSEIAKAQEQLNQERKEVRALEESLEVSRKVTAQGLLVGLARETLERESRIVEESERIAGEHWAAGLDIDKITQDYARAREALRLAEEIAELKGFE